MSLPTNTRMQLSETTEDRETVLFLSNDRSFLKTKFTKYKCFDLFWFNNILVYGDSIKDIVAPAGKLTIVVFFDFPETFFPILKFLYNILNLSIPTMVESTSEVEYPLIYTAIEPSHIKADPTSESAVRTQQWLRIVSLIHGGASTITTKTPDILNHNKSPIPIFTPSQNPSLYIPQHWDTWNRITLVSKSIHYDEQSTIPLATTDEILQSFKNAYLNYLNDDISLQELLNVYNIRGYIPNTSPTKDLEPVGTPCTISFDTIVSAFKS